MTAASIGGWTGDDRLNGVAAAARLRMLLIIHRRR